MCINSWKKKRGGHSLLSCQDFGNDIFTTKKKKPPKDFSMKYNPALRRVLWCLKANVL